MGFPVAAPEVGALFDVDAMVYELDGDGDESWLMPDETVFVEKAVAGRRREFAAGRLCARLALEDLGASRAPLLVGERRSPKWPDGWMGSISHTGTYCVAVAAAADSTASVGVDAERVGRVSDAVRRAVFTPAERDVLGGLDADDAHLLATVGFSAKEAFYKAQWPWTRSFVGFLDVEAILGARLRIGDRRPTASRRGTSQRFESILDLTLRPAPSQRPPVALDLVQWPSSVQAGHRSGIVVAAATINRPSA